MNAFLNGGFILIFISYKKKLKDGKNGVWLPSRCTSYGNELKPLISGAEGTRYPVMGPEPNVPLLTRII